MEKPGFKDDGSTKHGGGIGQGALIGNYDENCFLLMAHVLS